MFPLKKVTLVLALASAPTMANAAEKKTIELDDYVVTGTRSESALLDLAGNTSKISEQEIDLVRADHVTEIINRIPGVMIQRGNGQEHLTSIRSPVLTGGAGAGSFLYLEDGVPMRAAGFANVNGLFEANTEQAGGIEVVKGPGSALYGSNAVHGLVNVLSRSPSLDLERSVDFSAGPHDLYHFKGTVSDTIGNQAYRFSFNGGTDSGWIDDSGYDQQKMTFRHDYYGEKDTIQTVFNAANLNQETAGYENGFEAYKDTKESRINSNPEAYRDAKSARLSVRWDHEIDENTYFNVTPYVRHTEMEFLMHFLPGDAIERNEHQSVGVLTSYNHTLEGGHKIIVGTDFEYTQGELTEIQTDPAQFGYLPGTHFDYDVDATVIAPYVHSEWQVAEKTRVTAGLRYEYTYYSYDNNTTDGVFSQFLRPADRNDSFSNFSPKLGLTQRLTDDTSAFVNLARGNRAPQTTDLYRMRSSQNGIEADSEVVDSLEIGVRDLGKGFQYEVSTFFMKKRNYFFRDSAGENVPNGKTQHYGIELSGFMPLAHNFDISANVTYARHQYDFDNVGTDAAGSNTIIDGNDIDTAPRHMGSVRLGWNFMTGSRAELEWLHVGRYYTDAGNVHSYDGHDLLHLRASHKVDSHITLYGRITNLLNTEYAERADYNYVNAFNNTDRYFVGEERALHVGVTYDF
jgi:iron complex outermembrane receptor protein